MPTRVVLLHSPLTGPSLWQPVARLLMQRGVRASTPRLPALEHIYAPYWLAHAAAVAAALPEDDDLVLVAHSGAGVLLPVIGRLSRNRALHATLKGYVFVDCDLPRDGCSRLDLFDDPIAAEDLRQACSNGWMPAFNQAMLSALIRDDALRSDFVAELPRVPLAVYEEPLRIPDEWPEAPCAYLSLSNHYGAALAEAKRRGWPIGMLDTHHFAPITHPSGVADALLDLMQRVCPNVA